ncbi:MULTISPECIES: class I SAM-dependent methyltransferase [unclassified Treponema]|uniref:class I SAM-dependent methyltransferase n=1 Tax=unclassified Treponema TaxID=2638727 RepID=UPI0020A61881|nr:MULTISPECIES: class I SAM-dependent methyltransferase [unclassified Treponema]UTC66835.1 methyltransferase domain-containing protein [Treponema sp. OMZ 789]UTC69567.1 methyltransferase domain-containing protein [Treponema sp. OMZ 790]UTC72280.1 methyltransferase domain-containing protein [Treponema sp. OMZ 791]
MKTEDDFLREVLEMPYYSPVPKIIMNALRLGVFDELKTLQDSGQLAEKKGWSRENTEIFLQTLLSLGYLTKDGNRYRNCAYTDKYLLKESDYYAGPVLEYFGTDMGGSFPEDITPLLQKEPQAQDTSAKQDGGFDFAAMGNLMRAVQSGYNATHVKAALSEIEGVQKAKKVIDLGCGAGLYMLNLAKENPDMSLVLYDMPTMRPVIEKSIELTGMQKQTSIMCGDFTKEEIGTDYDLIFSSNSVYAAKTCIDEFMKKIYTALNPGGMFICISDGIEKDYSAPWTMVVSWMPQRLRGADMEMIKDAVREAGIKAGFTAVCKKSLISSGGHLDLDMDVLRKE